MTADLVSPVADVKPQDAIANLAALHGLAPWRALKVSRDNGHTVIRLSVPRDASEKWRAALAAPPFYGDLRDGYTIRTTRAIWMGAEVHLTAFGELL